MSENIGIRILAEVMVARDVFITTGQHEAAAALAEIVKKVAYHPETTANQVVVTDHWLRETREALQRSEEVIAAGLGRKAFTGGNHAPAAMAVACIKIALNTFPEDKS